GLREVLELTRTMIDKFWDGLYPELEDGDAEMRAVPLNWIGDKLGLPVMLSALTRKGLNSLQYKESREIGDEKSANTDQKKKDRVKLIAAGKITMEAFDKE